MVAYYQGGQHQAGVSAARHSTNPTRPTNRGQSQQGDLLLPRRSIIDSNRCLKFMNGTGAWLSQAAAC
jgi:hypothetical protein